MLRIDVLLLTVVVIVIQFMTIVSMVQNHNTTQPLSTSMIIPLVIQSKSL